LCQGYLRLLRLQVQSSSVGLFTTYVGAISLNTVSVLNLSALQPSDVGVLEKRSSNRIANLQNYDLEAKVK